MDSIITLDPVFKPMLWGGRKLETEFGFEIPDGRIGECWSISAHPNGDCTVSSGAYAGHALSWLWEHHRELFGNAKGDRFPLLIKIIDADDDLSIQVHPDDSYAAVNEDGSLGKKECWYVLSAEPNTKIVIGQNARSREEFAQMVAEQRWDELVNRIPVHTGDFFQIDAGTVHAILGGTVILEVQQSSDITYRVYDFDRKQADGTLRELHLDRALDVIDYDAPPPAAGEIPPAEGPVQVLEQNDRYTVERVEVAGELAVPTQHPFTCVTVTKGEGTVCDLPVHRGSSLLALAACEELEFKGDMEVVLAYC